MAVTHERHGVLGGSPKFINQVREHIANLDEQVYFFLNKYQQMKFLPNLNIQWLPELLNHVYGQETAHKLLQETRLL
ncbi:hypothetical protein [Crocosphaera sp. Alani8]|uniref:hypothetical protein n=1 Tax=Crocosphaera sp. Alani8 TaxID=3038952 RepID=UPI00313B4680